ATASARRGRTGRSTIRSSACAIPDRGGNVTLSLARPLPQLALARQGKLALVPQVMAQELQALRQRGLFRPAVGVRFTAERISGLNYQRQRVGPDGHLRRQPGVIKLRQLTVEIYQQH